MVKLSILMTVYNNEHDVLNAIKSVRLSSFTDWELIIIDDCSTDCSNEYIRGYLTVLDDDRIMLCKNDVNRGCYVSLNKGLLKTTGIYVVRIDSDDTIHPDKFMKQVKILDETPSCVGVTANHSRNNVIYKSDEINFMYRKSIINEIGYYDSVRFGADTEFIYRIFATYGFKRVRVIDETLYFAKSRKNSLTSSVATGTLYRSGKRIRKEYMQNFSAWHKDKNKSKNLYMAFPLSVSDRPFPVNKIMLP